MHLCGTVNGAAASTALVFQASGTSGNPITLLFEPNAVLQAPYWEASHGGFGGGAITMSSFGQPLSYLVVDGGTNGIIQNTANGDGKANQKDSEAISAWECNFCTIRNLNMANIYVHTSITSNTTDETQKRCIEFSGSHWTINHNVMHDVGWCLFQAYTNGNTDIQIYDNEIYNFTHGYALMGTQQGGPSGTNFYFHDNRVHDVANWDTTDCAYHHDGVHVFGTTSPAVSTLDGLYVSNNYFYGNWGNCQTGQIFVEANFNNANLKNSRWWNNVFTEAPGSGPSYTGIVGIFSGTAGGTTEVYNNTCVGANTTDGTTCFSLQYLAGLKFKNNVAQQVNNPMWIDASKFSSSDIDYNFYGTGGGGNNWFHLNQGYQGSFTSWKSACACDAHSVQNSSPSLGADGAPATGSPVLGAGLNLANLAIANLLTLVNDTTKGNTRTPTLRSLSAAWTPGAYGSGGSGGAATSVSISLSPLTSSLGPGGQQQFNATVTGSTTGVTWSLGSNAGTISASGLYTAPSSLSLTLVVQVKATSVADPTKSAVALVTLVPTVAPTVNVSIMPTSASVAAGGQQQFVTALTGSTSGVTWSMSPQMGTISTGGLYTAPSSVASQQTVRITATAMADTTKSATAALTVQPAAASAQCLAAFSGAKATISGPGGKQVVITLSRNASGTIAWTSSSASCP